MARHFGHADGKEVREHTLDNGRGGRVVILNYGGIVTRCLMPDARGRAADIALGFDTLAEYQANNLYFGAMVGRVGNRIAKGRFTLDGQAHQLATNNIGNHLHGGLKGFDKAVWDDETLDAPDGPALRLSYTSPDGEEGYPGTLRAQVVYTLTRDNCLRLEIEATTDRATPVNIVHHSYWNLDGADGRTVHDHEVMIPADAYTPTDATFIPTGIAPVAGTPCDFRAPKPVGRDIDALPLVGPADPGGYDMNWVIRRDGARPGELRLAARVRGPESGRVMEIWSDQPGLQFYTGNYLDNVRGKSGVVYPKRAGLCLETQTYPDSVNHQGEPGWPDVILRPGRTYRHLMVHKFSAE